MAVLALVLIVVWLVVVAGFRAYLQYRRTGAIRALTRTQPRSTQWWAKLLSVVGVMFAFAAPVAELAGLAPIGFLDHLILRIAGVVLVVLGIAGILLAQSAMGDSWRGDVDLEARTPLVTTGPFRVVRNPIFTSVATTEIGLALMVPNVFSALMLAAFLAAIQIQVRLVEEPYLLDVHGEDYRRYAARTGRFLPWIGRVRGAT
jgi:protein-S-isoprenylcysteine O-methyltransferase Ste14